MGSFQYFRLYICPAPGNAMASHVALLELGMKRFLGWGVPNWMESIFMVSEAVSMGASSISSSFGLLSSCPYAFMPPVPNWNRKNPMSMMYVNRILFKA